MQMFIHTVRKKQLNNITIDIVENVCNAACCCLAQAGKAARTVLRRGGQQTFPGVPRVINYFLLKHDVLNEVRGGE